VGEGKDRREEIKGKEPKGARASEVPHLAAREDI